MQESFGAMLRVVDAGGMALSQLGHGWAGTLT